MTERRLQDWNFMFNPYWTYDGHDSVMNEIELGFRNASDESSPIMHRFIKAFGVEYDLSHNYWRNVDNE